MLVLSGCTQVTEEEQASEETGPIIKVGNARGNVVKVTPSTIHEEFDRMREEALADCEKRIYTPTAIGKAKTNAIAWWEAAPEEERLRMCQLASRERDEQAIEAILAAPEKDWSKGYAPMGDGSIEPYAEVEERIKQWERDQGIAKKEAGQNVSNIPGGKPDPERAKCLSNYYKFLGPDKAGPESQRVTAEANARGVTPMDVVGC